MRLRQYQSGDLEEILSLYRQTVRSVNARDYTPQQISAWAPDQLDAERWSMRLSASRTVVAEESGAIVGFGNVEHGGHLDCLYVHRDHQGRGVASALLAALEDEARGIGLLALLTEASITARPFFERRGFLLVREQQVEFNGQRFTNFRMEKKL